MKRLAVILAVLAVCAGCKPVSALPDPGISPTVTAIVGR